MSILYDFLYGGIMYEYCKINNMLSVSRLYTFFRRKFPNGYFFHGENHDFYEVVYVVSGEVGITAGKKVFALKSGELTYHMPGEFHAIWENGHTEPEVIIFSFAAQTFPITTEKIFTLNGEEKKELSDIYTSVNENFEIVNTSTVGIRTECETDAILTIKRLEMLLIKILERTSDHSERSYYSQDSEIFSNILSLLEARLGDGLTLNDIAQLCGISVPTIEKAFYKYLGYGAIAHYNILKMQKAHTMLLAGCSVKETSASLGFSNQNYFSARFKKYYGYSPSKTSLITFREVKHNKKNG